MIKDYTPDNIRNISLVGHSGTGKTSINESILFLTGAINAKGTVEQGNTVSDFDEDEKKKKFSLKNCLAFIEHNNVKINIIDTPGMADFSGEVISALRITESAIVVVDSVDGVQMETVKIWRMADSYNLPRAIFINKMDKERADFHKVVDMIKEKFGAPAFPVQIPIGKEAGFSGVIDLVKMKALMPDKGGKSFKEQEIPADLLDEAKTAHEELVEAIADVDDKLIEKFLEGNPLTTEEVSFALKLAIEQGKVYPVSCGSSDKNINIIGLLHLISEYMPSPAKNKEIASESLNPENKVNLSCNPSESFAALIYKTRIDQFSGRHSYFKIFSGEITTESEVFDVNSQNKIKPGHIYSLIGNKQIEVSKLIAGDIGCITKVDTIQTNHTLCDLKKPVKIDELKYPQPVFFLAIQAENKNDEDKIGTMMNRIMEEDPTFIREFNAETKETVIKGMGEMQINIILDQIKEKNKINILTRIPRIAYQETITRKGKAEYKHKKQSGGRGQYGHVLIEVEPLERSKGFEFVDKIVGGRIPKNYIPGVEKGLREGMIEGKLAGFPLTDIRVLLIDGSYHEVDSSELAFKLAAINALRKAVEGSNPILLEPIMNVNVFAEKDLTGDILSDVQGRRGRVLGMGDQKEGSDIQIIKAQIPLAELLKYSIELRSITSGRATFDMSFSHYEPLSGQLAEKVIQEAQRVAAEENK